MDNLNPPKQPVLPNENQYNDYDKTNDVLLSLKSLLSGYTTFIIECSHLDLQKELIELQKETYCAQREIFDVMYSKGWYPLEKQTPEKIQKIHQEYSSKETQL